MNDFWQTRATAFAKTFPRERLEKRAFAEISRAVADGEPIAIACSGGIDSLAALLLVHAHFPHARAQIFALHFNHAKRGLAADGDADFVAEVCTALGIGFFCEKLSPAAAENAHSESELRDARLDFFARTMRAKSAKILVQGHQADDVAESLLMRICRGAGTGGLAAPRPISPQGDGRIFARPLLEISKSELRAALEKNAIPWREDASNAEPDFFRNRLRNAILPALENAAPFTNFARARALAEEDADALDALAAQLKLGETRVPALARRQLWKIFLEEKISPGAKNFDALVAAVCSKTPLKFSAGDREIVWDGATLAFSNPTKNSATREDFHFESEIVEITPELFAQIRAGAFSPSETVFLAGAENVFARARRNGDKFRPLGAPGEKSLGDIFTDKKIPRECRDKLPVFCDGTGIAWVPGLPPADRFRIASAGCRALRLTYRSASLLLCKRISNE